MAIVEVRPGVQFESEAADAFMRAEAQVNNETGHPISVNSTWRSWGEQLSMFNAWNAYVAGRAPHPGHSKAVHPIESFHVDGYALDSDDWTDARVVNALAYNGFIRNRLYVQSENHHFEYLAEMDQNRGEDMFSDNDRNMLNNIYAAVFTGGVSMQDGGNSISKSLATISSNTRAVVKRYDGNKKIVDVPWIQELADAKTMIAQVVATLAEINKKIDELDNGRS